MATAAATQTRHPIERSYASCTSLCCCGGAAACVGDETAACCCGIVDVAASDAAAAVVAAAGRSRCVDAGSWSPAAAAAAADFAHDSRP